jgi:transglutaminase-like putative cysteine protease
MRVDAISGSIGAVPTWDITPLLPKVEPNPSSIVDILPTPKNSNDIFSILTNKLKMEWVLIQFRYGGVEQESETDYTGYLQYPNPGINALAKSIVEPHDSNDTKMFKIEQWVQQNIKYQSDMKTYGQSELWAYPTMTVSKKVGDCEDGAFLMHSLALNAGIPPERLRTYGGLVWADNYGLTTGGHGWTAYKRETDDRWVITDWCYWPTDTPISDRSPMPERKEYIDDYFYVSANKTVESPYANYVKNPMGRGTYSHQETGLLVSRVV